MLYPKTYACELDRLYAEGYTIFFIFNYNS